MLNFLKPIAEKLRKKHAEALSAREQVVELIRRGTANGELDPAEQNTLYGAMEAAGMPLERIEADAEYIGTFLRHEQAAAELEKRRALMQEANQALSDHSRRRRELIDRMNGEEDDLQRRAAAAMTAFTDSRNAAKTSRKMQHDRPDLVGPHERWPAFLILADGTGGATIAEFSTSTPLARLQSYWRDKLAPFERDGVVPDGYDVNTANKERSRLGAARRASIDAGEKLDREIAASGYKVLAINPEHPEACHIDPTDYDFRVAPGQSQAEFGKLKAIVDRQAADNVDYQRQLAARTALNQSHNEQAAAAVQMAAAD